MKIVFTLFKIFSFHFPSFKLLTIMLNKLKTKMKSYLQVATNTERKLSLYSLIELV